MSEKSKKEESVVIEFNTTMEYRDGEAYILKLNTNEMDAPLACDLCKAFGDTIKAYFAAKENRKKEAQDGLG